MNALPACCAALAVAACGPTIPDSGFDTGFDPAREARLDGGAVAPSPILPPAGGVIAPPASEAEELAARTRLVLGAPPARTGIDASAPIGAPAPLPQVAEASATGSAGISSEQDFGAVASERSIEQDAERLRRLRAQRALIEADVEPIDLTRPADAGPNVVQYALRRARTVGSPGYDRGLFQTDRSATRKCAAYANADAAQQAFLGGGGPERDRLGLDPDGDGNACGWDPAVYRNIVAGG